MGSFPESTPEKDLTGSAAETFQKNKSIFIELWDRRVFHILGIYLGGSWAVLEFISSLLVDRFYMSDQWISLSFVLLISLIPSVLMVAWFHGRPGPDKWNNIEKIGIPINFAITLLLLTGIYGGKDLNAKTEELKIIDGQGQTIIKTVPKEEYKKAIAVIFQQSKTDSGVVIDLYDLAAADMLYQDLRQEQFFSIQSPWDQQTRFRQEGLKNDEQLMSLSLVREQCRQQMIEYFIIPDLNFTNHSYSLKIRLYHTDKLSLVLEKEFSDSLPFNLIDEASRSIKTALKVPEKFMRENADLPVSELMTGNMDALMHYIEALESFTFHHDYIAAIEKYDQALAIDSYFAQALLQQGLLFMLVNDNQKLHRLYDRLMELLYKLTGTDRYYVKYFYYMNRQEYEKGAEVLTLWKKAHPEDDRPYYYMARNHHENAGDFRNFIRELMTIVERDPSKFHYQSDISRAYMTLGEYDSAETCLQKFRDAIPENIEPLLLLATLYMETGRFDKADEMLNQSELLKPKHISVLIQKSILSQRRGDFADAERLLYQALHFSASNTDSATVFEQMGSLYYQQGRLSEALEAIIKYEQSAAGDVTPYRMLMNKIQHIELFVWLGQDQIALEIIERLKSLWSAAGDLYLFADLNYAVAKKDPTLLEITIEQVEKSTLPALFGLTLENNLNFARGQLEEFREKPQMALKYYQQAADDSRLWHEIRVAIGRCFRKNTDFRLAEKELTSVLRRYPASPEAHYELARLYWDWNKREKALKHMEIATGIWNKAHKNHPLAKEAAGLYRQWKIVSML
jgi:tetratricopeptide (TPR) repeat protein